MNGKDTTVDRKQQAIIALHDYGSREGATPAKLKRNMKNAGFTAEEIAEAARALSGDKQ
jgi:SOS response regulatory protein OraA/RecX